MAEQDKIEKLLDHALGEYGQVSARAGLENRVLARLESAESSRRVRWWWIGVPAMAVLVVVALVMTMHPKPVQVDIASIPPVRAGVQPAPSTLGKTVPRESSVQHPSKRVRPKAPARTSPKTRDSEPRLATFPSRDNDDQLLRLAMRFVKTNPAEATEIVQEQQEFREMAATFTAPLKEEK